MKSYEDIGLSPNLQSQDSLAVKTTNQTQNITNLVSEVYQNLNPNINNTTVIDGLMFKQIGTNPVQAYYIGGQMTANTGLGTQLFTADILRAAPFLSTRGGVIDRIACNVTGTSAAGEFRMGIYQATSQTNLYPNNLIVDAGTFNSTAGAALRTASISITLQPNTLYWLVHIQGNNSAPFRRVIADDCFNLLGVGTGFTEAYYGIEAGFTYGTLPATFPTGGTIISSSVPGVGLRFLA